MVLVRRWLASAHMSKFSNEVPDYMNLIWHRDAGDDVKRPQLGLQPVQPPNQS